MDLAAYIDGGLTAQERGRLENHLAGCDYCLGQIAAITQMQEAELPQVDPIVLRRARPIPQVKTRSQWAQAWRWAAVSTAAACLALTITLWVRPSQRTESDTVRTGNVQPTTIEMVAPRDGSAVRRVDVEFRWTPVNRAIFYDIRVLSADGDLVWQSRSDNPAARPPAGVKFTVGQRYFVLVSAWLPEGKTIKSSAIGFRVSDQ
jgi:hypothetical protein